MSIKGIDISHWNPVYDWSKIKKDFIFLKASQGTRMVDPKFEAYKKEARKTGAVVGFYHFADGFDAVMEAQHFLKTVGEILPGEILILDFEINMPGSGHWCYTFLQYVEKKVGFKPLLYTNEARVKSIDWKEVVAGNYGLWVAKYGINIPFMGVPPTSGPWPFWVIWQYTSRGSVPGIYGNVDLNHSDVSKETLRKYGKQDECNHCCKVHCK